MARGSRDQIHALAIPTRAGSLLVPSATIAEVVNVSTLAPIPLGQVWLLGAISWRTMAVPVISIEALFGQAPLAANALSKAVVFYPLSGRAHWEYFAVLSSAEPRPQPLDASAIAVPPAELPKSYVAAGLKIGGQTMWIPDFEGLKQAFYPL
jgi:chemosensory pili system protein ChpC